MSRKENLKLLFIISSVFAMLKAILSVQFAFMLKTFLEYFENGTREEIQGQILNALLYLALYLIVELAYNYFESRYITKNMGVLKSKSMGSILNTSIIGFNRRHSGEYLSLLTNDAKAVEDDYFGSVFDCVTMVFSLIISVGALIYLNPILGTVSVVCSVLSLILPVMISNKLNTFRNKISHKQDYLTRKTKSILDGFETIRTYDVESKVANDYNESVYDVEHHNQILKFFLKTSSTIGRLMAYIVFFVIIFTGLFLSIQNRLPFGVLLASIQLSNNLVSPIVSGVQMIAKIRSVKGIRKKFGDVVVEKESKKTNKNVEFNKAIALSNVSFTYSDDIFVLKNISLEIEKGKKYAIIGESGSGKSTLGKILMGIYNQFSGEMLIDDVDVKAYDAETITKLFSVTNQNTFILDDTIEKNVSFYKSIPIEQINGALAAAQLSQFIGSENLVGENGVLLSGGEKQRISLARAFANDCPIIMMDEATSQLDNENMLKIENLVLQSDKTVITITHRLVKEVLQRYDFIYLLSNGEIVERGTFDELIDKKGLLYSLYYVFGD